MENLSLPEHRHKGIIVPLYYNHAKQITIPFFSSSK